jgi:hypothetical protein
MSTLYTVTVDTEEEWDWSSGWPIDNPSTANIEQLPRFQEICSCYGAAVTYFTDLAVLDNARAREILLGIARQPRVEIGMHIHPWNTPPLHHRGPVAARETFLHNLSAEVIRAKLTRVYERFQEYGLTPTSFRGGRYSSGGVIHDFLRDKGFLADASVLPYSTWADDGAPDYCHRGLLPVRLPPRRAGEQPLWDIPLTLAFSRRPFAFWRAVYSGIENSPLRHLRLVGLAEKIGLVRKVWLNLENPLGRNMLPFLSKLRRMKLPCVCFTLHSSSLMVGGNNYTPATADADRLFAYVDAILGTISGWDDFQPATVTEVALQQEQNHACSRN